MRAVDIFIAYSHNDLGHKNELKKFLRPLINTGQARLWDDHEIEGGQDWEAEIKKRLYGSDIILLLVSPDSLASEYFYGQEVKVSLERHDKGESVVVPVILRPCTWTLTPLKRLEALPEKARPVTSWASQDEAYTDIAQHIGAIVESRQVAIAAATAQENQRREFAAAAEAAEHLFHKKQWQEAQKAFASALQLHQPGFSPDRASLQNRIAACVSEQQQAAARVAWEEKRKEYQGLLDAAAFSENPKQAVQHLQKALALYQPGFPESPETLNDRIRQLRAYKAPAPPAVEKPVAPSSSGEKPAFNTKALLIAGAAVLLVLVAIFAMRQCGGERKQPERNNTEPQTEKPTAPASNWQSAATIPALENWLQQNSGASIKDRADANQRLKTWRQDSKRDLDDAKQALQYKEYGDAEKYIQNVLRLNPEDEEARQLQKKIPKR